LTDTRIGKLQGWDTRVFFWEFTLWKVEKKVTFMEKWWNTWCWHLSDLFL